MTMIKQGKLSPAKEEEITRTQWERYTRARDHGHLEYVEMAKTCDAYYQGDQWDAETASELEAEGRPALTINTILPTVNTIMGEQSQRRADIQFKPRRAGSEEVAHTLTKLYLQIADNNKLDWVEQQVFADGLIMDGRGYFDVRMDFTDHVEGEVRITSKDPLDIIIDPDAKEADPKTWDEVFESKWMTLGSIEEAYGKDKADRLLAIAENGMCYGADSVEYEETRFGDDDAMQMGTFETVMGDDEYRQVKCLRVIERQHKKIARAMFFVDPDTGDQRQSPDEWNEAKSKKFAKKWNLTLVKKVIKKVRWTVTCDQVVLHDAWSPYNDFTIVPFFCYFRRGNPFGIIRNLLSPQEQLNKIASQELHIVNSTANSGWIVETGALVGMTADDLSEHGAETGLVLEHARGTTPPTKIQANQIPTGLDRIAQKAAQNIKTISGINDSMLGTDSAEVSGIAIQAKQNRGAIMIQVPLDNLRKSRQYLAEKILNLIQTFYTEQRVIKITNEEDPLEPREDMIINETSAAGEIINNLTLGEYDVIVGTAPARDSFDEIQFAEAVNLRTAGVAIPDDAIVGYSHLAKKAELAKRLRVRNGEEPPTPEQQEAMAQQQQVQMRMLELEIEKLEAENRKIQSEAALNIAKVQDLVEVAPAIREQEMATKKQISDDSLDLRRELGDKSSQSKTEALQTNSATKLATTAFSATKQNDHQTHNQHTKPHDNHRNDRSSK